MDPELSDVNIEDQNSRWTKYSAPPTSSGYRIQKKSSAKETSLRIGRDCGEKREEISSRPSEGKRDDERI